VNRAKKTKQFVGSRSKSSQQSGTPSIWEKYSLDKEKLRSLQDPEFDVSAINPQLAGSRVVDAVRRVLGIVSLECASKLLVGRADYELVGTVEAIHSINNGDIPICSIVEFQRHLRAFVSYQRKNKDELLRMGYCKQRFHRFPWFDRTLSNLLPVGSLDAGFPGKGGQQGMSHRDCKMVAGQRRPLYEAKLEVLKTLLHCVNSDDYRSLWKSCLSILSNWRLFLKSDVEWLLDFEQTNYSDGMTIKPELLLNTGGGIISLLALVEHLRMSPIRDACFAMGKEVTGALEESSRGRLKVHEMLLFRRMASRTGAFRNSDLGQLLSPYPGLFAQYSADGIGYQLIPTERKRELLKEMWTSQVVRGGTEVVEVRLLRPYKIEETGIQYKPVVMVNVSKCEISIDGRPGFKCFPKVAEFVAEMIKSRVGSRGVRGRLHFNRADLAEKVYGNRKKPIQDILKSYPQLKRLVRCFKDDKGRRQNNLRYFDIDPIKSYVL